MATTPTSTWAITAGVRLHGRTRATPDAMHASPATAMNARTVRATPLDAWEDRPAEASTALSTPATHKPTASTATATAASVSSDGRRAVTTPAQLAGERIPIVSHPSRPG